MIAFIKGKVFEIRQNSVVIDVNGVGYEINTSLSTIGACSNTAGDILLYTETYLREDLIALYGFASKDELTMFDQLISVSGVGPKVALQIMSGISTSSFAISVLNDDFKELTKISGVGPKLAQRIILELKDKIKKECKTQNVILTENLSTGVHTSTNISDECTFALCALGFTPQVAKKAVADVYTDGMSTEDTIKAALKILAKF